MKDKGESKVTRNSKYRSLGGPTRQCCVLKNNLHLRPPKKLEVNPKRVRAGPQFTRHHAIRFPCLGRVTGGLISTGRGKCHEQKVGEALRANYERAWPSLGAQKGHLGENL